MAISEEEAQALKVGDLVLVSCKVLGTDHEGTGGRFYITCSTLDETPQDFAAYVSAIHSVLPRPLAIGDRVRLSNRRSHQAAGEVIATYPGYTWVKWSDDAHPVTYGIAELERVSPSPSNERAG